MESKFAEIFKGLKRNYGCAKLDQSHIDPSTGKIKPIYEWTGRSITDQDYLDHLNGIKSIGIQPCDDNGMAQFGAIDIDDKQHSYVNFPYKKYLDIIQEYKLPLIPVKSKSGGLHLYLFLKQPAKAVFIRNFLDKLLLCLKLPPNVEIYPKQTELGKDSEGVDINGNFINLPYYNKTERTAFNFDGTKFTFDQFIKVVEANTYTPDELEEFSIEHVKQMLMGGGEEFVDGPPCLQRMTREKLSDGRDRFLYNYMVFAKKKYPDNWEEMVKGAPNKYFAPDSNGNVDWSEDKTKKKLSSWGKETKGHTCNEDPIFNFCMKAECRNRKFGYLSDKKRIFPALSGLQKITYPEPEYTFNVTLQDGQTTKEVRAKNIKQVIVQDEIRAIIANAAGVVPPKVKQNDFQDILDSLFPPKLTTSPPKGTSPDELLDEYLREYLRGPKATTYAAFKKGATLVEEDSAFFVFSSFYDALKNKEWKESKPKTAEAMQRLFNAEFGVSKRFKNGDDKASNPVNCTRVPIDKFKAEKSTPEIIPIKSKKDIF